MSEFAWLSYSWVNPRWQRMVVGFHAAALKLHPPTTAGMLARAWANKLHFRLTYPPTVEALLAEVLETMYS